MAAIADIPIKVSDQTKSSLQRYSSGDLGAVFLALDSETEILNAEVEGKATAKDIADKLPVLCKHNARFFRACIFELLS